MSLFFDCCFDKREDSLLKEKNRQEVQDVIKRMKEYKFSVHDPKVKNSLYNRCKSIIDHDFWYSEIDRTTVAKIANETLTLTPKQKAALKCSCIKPRDEDDYFSDGANSDEDRRWAD